MEPVQHSETAAPRAAIAILRSSSLSSAIQREIEQRILGGAIRAGERINENRLSKELGVSRGPIREACRGLVEAGLLSFVVNRGFFVRAVTAKEAADVYDVRAALMRLAGETLAARISDAQLAALADLVDRMDSAAAADDTEGFYALNLEFHERLVDYTANDRLKAICAGLVKELHLYRRRSIIAGGGIKVSNQEHKRILAALQARDTARAGGEMERHILAGKARFLEATAIDRSQP